jgi:hypothetical protein
MENANRLGKTLHHTAKLAYFVIPGVVHHELKAITG